MEFAVPPVWVLHTLLPTLFAVRYDQSTLPAVFVNCILPIPPEPAITLYAYPEPTMCLACIFPLTSNFEPGVAVPMPISPVGVV